MTDWGLIEENLRLLSDPKVLSNLEAAWQAGDLQQKTRPMLVQDRSKSPTLWMLNQTSMQRKASQTSFTRVKR